MADEVAGGVHAKGRLGEYTRAEVRGGLRLTGRHGHHVCGQAGVGKCPPPALHRSRGKRATERGACGFVSLS